MESSVDDTQMLVVEPELVAALVEPVSVIIPTDPIKAESVARALLARRVQEPKGGDTEADTAMTSEMESSVDDTQMLVVEPELVAALVEPVSVIIPTDPIKAESVARSLLARRLGDQAVEAVQIEGVESGEVLHEVAEVEAVHIEGVESGEVLHGVADVEHVPVDVVKKETVARALLARSLVDQPPVKAEAVARALLARRLVDEAVGQSSKLIREATMTARRLLETNAVPDVSAVPDASGSTGRVARGILARRMASQRVDIVDVVEETTTEKKTKKKKKPKKKKDKKRK
jgi:hypothetical protein